MLATMQRIDGFAGGQSPDQGWVTLKVKVRPEVAAALENEALRESETLHRRVYVADLIRDGIRLLLIARRADPAAPKTRFVPSERSPR